MSAVPRDRRGRVRRQHGRRRRCPRSARSPSACSSCSARTRVFWTMPAALLSGTAAAAGIALINSIGNLGGFVGPYLVGLLEGRDRLDRRRPDRARADPARRRRARHARRPRPGSSSARRARSRASRATASRPPGAGRSPLGRPRAADRRARRRPDRRARLRRAAVRAGGLDPLVVWRPEDLPRAVPPARRRGRHAHARRAARPARDRRARGRERLRALGCERFEQRIDSTLRGAPAEELAGLLEGAGLTDAVVVAVPAFPDAGRVCAGGHPARREPRVDVAARAVRRRGAEVVRPEALRRASRAGATRAGRRRRERRRPAGGGRGGRGAARTSSPPRRGGWLQLPPARPARAEFVLVVLGSNTELNHRQLERLRDARAASSPASPPRRARGRRRRAHASSWQTILERRADDVRRDPRWPTAPPTRRPRCSRSRTRAGCAAAASWPAAGTWPRGWSTRSAPSGSAVSRRGRAAVPARYAWRAVRGRACP